MNATKSDFLPIHNFHFFYIQENHNKNHSFPKMICYYKNHAIHAMRGIMQITRIHTSCSPSWENIVAKAFLKLVFVLYIEHV